MNVQANIEQNILNLQVQRSDFALLLNECRKENKLTDVELDVGGKLFPAHRAVLSLYSPVLEAAVSDKWSTSKICSISEEYVDPWIVEDLLSFLYTGSIQLTPDNVHPVCVAAHFLQIKTLLEPSVEHLCRLITVENVLELFESSFTCQLELLRFACLRIIYRNHEEVFEDSRILSFSRRIFSDLISGLKEQSRPRVMLKENTFDCIVRWTEENLLERLDELPGLLKNIPLEELSLMFLTETVSKHALLKDFISCKQVVSQAIAYVTKRRLRSQNMIAVGIDRKTELQSISCYDCLTKLWRKLPNMLEPRRDFGVTVVNRKDIVICGGISLTKHPKVLDSVEMFDWSSQTWKKLPAMPKPISHCSMATLNGDLYVVGGGNRNKQVLCYSFENRKWKYVKRMNVERIRAKLIEYDNYLYVFEHEGTAARYDSVVDKWAEMENSLNPRSHKYGKVFTAAVHRNRIFTFDFNSFKEYDPETHSLIQHSRTKDSDIYGNIASVNGQLLVAKHHSKLVYGYNYFSRMWTKFCKMEAELKDAIIVAGEFY